VVVKREILLLLAVVIKYLLLIGSNLGNRKLLLEQAVESIGAVSVGPVVCSQLYESEPWGFDSKDWFLNRAVSISSEMEPPQMLSALLKIEKSMGRLRSDLPGYASRSIDIDILLAGAQIINTDVLQIPHPRMHQRKFVLLPAAEIAGAWVHPIFGANLNELLEQCKDKSNVRAL
jgi:2-amino-4-hydroxy-6-hydroxymethyldihydropteridine diphosphokinase